MKDLFEFATQMRIQQMKSFGKRGFGHVGGSLSATDCIAALYGELMNIDPADPKKQDRDRFVCSKGHAGPAVYSALALKGFFPLEWLDTLNEPYTRLPSHCDCQKTPGVDMSTGSLGQGGSIAAGMALGLKLSQSPATVYLMLGDGECDEGQVWEMALFAGAKKINNLIAFVDYNHKQLDGTTEEVLDLGDIAEKFASFGWYAKNIPGNDPYVIAEAVKTAKAQCNGRPSVLVLQTQKGAGVSGVAEKEFNHHIVVDEELAKKALIELTKRLESKEGSNV